MALIGFIILTVSLALIASCVPFFGLKKTLLTAASAAIFLICFWIWFKIQQFEDHLTTADAIDVMRVCYITPPPITVDVGNSAIVEVVINHDTSGCMLRDTEGRIIEITQLVGVRLSSGGFNGDITPIGAEVQPLDARRREARWKWALKPDVPGTYELTLVATAQDSSENLYMQDIRGTVQVHAEGTFGYHASNFGRWLKEAIGTTQIVTGGIVAIVATFGTFFVKRKRGPAGKRASSASRHSLRSGRRPILSKRRTITIRRPARSSPSPNDGLSDRAS